ncbi:MAG: ERCC4 domain-containing protein [Candidatus Micrarchaeota archaeon]|nr:ERCC4 domain-containing protein [Candidatus Micrarchaeota archaeon]
MDVAFDETLSAAGTLQIIIDDRELKSAVAKDLFRKGVVLKPSRLPVGDFVLSDTVAVERKNDADFEASIIDGRLFVQAGELKNQFSSPLLALVGSRFERISPKALRGAFISLAVDYKLPVFFFETDAELADFLAALAEREQLLEKRAHRVQFAKKTDSLSHQQRLVAESLPGLGPKNAESLLRHFKTLQSLANADETALQAADGIGKERAKAIRRVFESGYDL